ncbi:lysophospholipid acyltransferase family protein [Luteolibacter sp. LG18]|uniref:lysophospholipid acyltransferase family protein n=1 Tax=Luteolibacter sp. LG18 TaxID=2819286 RepID=UPI002B2C1C48|nr:lipoprotein [Luteolibacter sp. LG18]
MADAASRHEIRKSRKTAIFGTLAGGLMRLWCATLRYEIVDRCKLGVPEGIPGPVIYALWHNRLFSVPKAWKRLCGKHRRAAVLTSASHDGDVLSRAMGAFGIGAVRGSSSRRAIAALVGLKRALVEGVDVCLTPDGPRGPRYKLQGGLVKLAQTTGAPVIPVHVELSSCWRLKSWDRFMIPKPFSRVRIIFDQALAVPASLSDDAFETERARIESVLLAATHDSEPATPAP